MLFFVLFAIFHYTLLVFLLFFPENFYLFQNSELRRIPLLMSRRNKPIHPAEMVKPALYKHTKKGV